MLIPLNKLYSFLCAPNSKNNLKKNKNKLHDIKNNKIYHFCDNTHPILIDFPKSIFSLKDIKSQKNLIVRNKSKKFFFVKNLVSSKHSKNVSKKNIKHIIKISKNSKKKLKVLIIGGGKIGNGMDFFYSSKNYDLIAFDVYKSPYTQFIADAHNLPLKSNLIDIVIIQAVLEHVAYPKKVVDEIYRVLKIEGVVYAETPFLQHVHEGAYDFNRFTLNGHRLLFEDFSLINSGYLGGSGTQLLWSIDYFFSGLFSSRKIGKFFKLIFFWLSYFDYLIPKKFNVDSASGSFFLGQKKKKKKFHLSNIINFYSGAQK